MVFVLAPDNSPDQAERILQDLSHDLMSPYCPGRTIASCPSKAARKLEDDILAQAKAGKSREDIEGAMVERFGPDIIGYKPPPLVLYGTIVGGALALGLLLAAGRRWVRQARGVPAGGPADAVKDVAKGAAAGPSADRPTRAELDALEDALDDEDAF